MATKKKKSPPRRRSTPARKRSLPAAPAQQAPQAKAGLSYWPLAILVLAGGGIFYALNANKPAVTVTNNLPPARSVVPSEPAPSSAAAPAARPSCLGSWRRRGTRHGAQEGPFGRNRGPSLGTAAWIPKSLSRVLATAGQDAEVPIFFNAKNKLIRKLHAAAPATAARSSLVWDGKDSKGRKVPASEHLLRALEFQRRGPDPGIGRSLIFKALFKGFLPLCRASQPAWIRVLRCPERP